MPSLLNVAECQNEKFESATAPMRDGFAGFADVEQEAVAAARAAGETDRRVDGDVVALRRAAAVAARVAARQAGQPRAAPLAMLSRRAAAALSNGSA